MSSDMLVKKRHEARRFLGVLLSKIRLHRLEFVSIEGVAAIRKQRRWFASLIITFGNVFLKLTESSMLVLPRTQWLEWERVIEASTQRNLILGNSSEPIHKGRDLLCRCVSGRSLRRILDDSGLSIELKLDAIRCSLTALRFLHQNHADWGHGIYQSISHGDATTNNVIVDLNDGSACWIDFDTRHQPKVSEADRHSDDLRCLIYSAAASLPASSFPQIAEILITARFDDALLQHFRKRLTNEWSHLTTAQLAQAPLRWSVATALRTALVRELAVEKHDK